MADIEQTMNDFTQFLGFVNLQLYSQQIERLKSMLMPANLSSIVGEFMGAGIPKYCAGLVNEYYHNGHADLISDWALPRQNAAQHTDEGIEIKASRYLRAWQGHNPEDTWLMVFVFDSNRPPSRPRGEKPAA